MCIYNISILLNIWKKIIHTYIYTYVHTYAERKKSKKYMKYTLQVTTKTMSVTSVWGCGHLYIISSALYHRSHDLHRFSHNRANTFISICSKFINISKHLDISVWLEAVNQINKLLWVNSLITFKLEAVNQINKLLWVNSLITFCYELVACSHPVKPW